MKYALLLIGVLLTALSNGQEYLPLEHLGIQDGLSFRHVSSIYKDSQGFMWFCTKDGLNRYDGVDWVVYKYVEGDSTSIPGNTVDWIYEDPDGDFIISINDNLMKHAFFNKKEGKFQKLIFRNINSEKEEGFIRQPFISKSGNIITFGRILIKDKNEPSKNKWKYKYHLFNYLGNGVFEAMDEIKDLHEDFNPTVNSIDSEKYWFNYHYYYRIFDLGAGTLTKYEFADLGGFKSIPIDKNGRFWYPDLDSNSGKLFNSFQLPVNIPLENWQNLRMDNHGNIWIKEKSGKVFKFDMERKSLNENGEFKISYFSIKDLLQDQDGTLWLPGRYGIDKVIKKRKYFKQFTKDLDAGKVRAGIAIYSIVETDDGKIHALYGYNKMFSIDPGIETDTGSVKLIGYKNGKRKVRLLASEIALLPAANNHLWIYDMNRIHLYNPLTYDIKTYPSPKEIPKFKPEATGNKAASFSMDESGKLWFIVNDRLVSFDTLSKVYHFNPDEIFIKGIVGIGEGQKWIGSSTKLSKFDDNKEVVKQYDIPEATIPGNNIEIFKVVIYNKRVWIGTRTGLLEFDPEAEQFIRYTTNNGLSHNIIYTIIPDGDYLWIGTHYGLCHFNTVTKEVKNYYVHDGLSHNEFNREAACKSSDGRLYFGSMNGVNAFYPEELKAAARLESSRLVWTKFSKIDSKLNDLTIHQPDQEEPKPVEIYHGDQSFTFHYALLNFLNPSSNTYSYYLDGFELDWKYAKNISTTNYPILPPGEYVFRVKAKDALGNPASNQLAIPVIVYGPWWSNWWVRGGVGFLFLSTIVGYYKWRTTSLKRQSRALEQTVKERTLELEMQKERAERSERFKEQFLANMSHEIRTPMHAISGMTNILARNEHPAHQDKFLKAIQQSSGNLLVILNDILDLSKIEAGKIEIQNVPVRPKEVMENVVSILKAGAEEKGLMLHTKIADNIPEYVYGDSTRLSQILLNLLGNAIKFTEKGSVTISLKTMDNKLRFDVEDTGIGIPEDNLQRIFETFEQVNESMTRKYKGTGLGLSITKQLVELQNGKVWVESKEQIGSTFSFELPLVVVEEHTMQDIRISEQRLKEMGAALTGIRILLVEDNDFNVMVATDDLTYYIEEVKIGFAENGKVAIQEFETGKYDLILMDIQMPELNGYEATRAIRKIENSKGTSRTPIPIIAMTASLLKSEIQLCYDAGMNNYIPKPYKIEELISAIYTETQKLKQ